MLTGRHSRHLMLLLLLAMAGHPWSGEGDCAVILHHKGALYSYLLKRGDGCDMFTETR
jgi:hypothetical protein